MNVLKSTNTPEETTNLVNIKIWRVINDTLSKVFTFLSFWNIKINWLENIDKSKNYLIIANHPSFADWFLIRDIFLSNNIPINWIMHNSIMESKFIWDYYRSEGHIWVLNMRSEEYYIEKWFSTKQAKLKFESRYLKSKRINKTAFIKSQTVLEAWWNLFIFVSWGWYKSISDNPEVHNWYKKIVSDHLKSADNINLLPVTIELLNWYKNGSFPFKNDVEISFLTPLKIDNLNKFDIFNQIELIYNPWFKNV